ncbi:uncharacterized protein [Nicotiana sylvestris]|uniref:uncharacterized protein n=1 Tax=Nicotiana sylvestris TaxID=4096 RepID=UPI00388C49DC
MVGERVFLRVLAMKGVMRFGKKGKLSPRYIRRFKILERVDEVSYKLALPQSLSAVHLVFHAFMLRKEYGDMSHVLDFSSVQLDKDLTYIEEPVTILARQVRKEIKEHCFSEGSMEGSSGRGGDLGDRA